MVVTKKATEETCRSRSPKKNRGIIRPDEATEAFLELRAEESIQMCLEHAKPSKETRAVYCCLSTLSQLSGNYFNPKELQSLKRTLLSEEHYSALSIEICESFLLCFAICYLEVISPYLLFVCMSGSNGKFIS